MTKSTKLKVYLAFVLLLVVGLVSYKVYISIVYADVEAVNAKNVDLISQALADQPEFNFAVLGSINNSMRLFEKRIVPDLEKHDVDFVVSVGNAVFDGSESKYQLFLKGMQQVDLRFLLTLGTHEIEGVGAQHYYHFMGPYFYSFQLQNRAFIMLDTTGQTSWRWQWRWLNKELERAQGSDSIFIFMNASPLTDPMPESLREYAVRIRQLFAESQVTAVFSMAKNTYAEHLDQGVRYVTVGRAGGLLLEKKNQYQYAWVSVNEQSVDISGVVVESTLGEFQNKFETLKMYLYSFFYMSLFNALVLCAVAGLVSLRVYSKIIKQDAYYRDFNLPDDFEPQHPLNIAIFTNNYLPFIGGVPVSIDRLRRGLERLGHRVTLFAPTYCAPLITKYDPHVVRVPTLMYERTENFAIPNVASPVTKAQFSQQKFDVVHVHHPFLLGAKGLRLAKHRGIPVVFTYHTRLERYTHYFPLPGTHIKALMVHFLVRRFANHCQAVITPTVSTEEYLRQLGVSAIIETIPTGINTDVYQCQSDAELAQFRLQYAQPNEKLLITVSRLTQEKNLDFLLEGIKKVQQKTDAPFKLLVVGDGPEKAALQAAVEQSELRGKIYFSGSLAPEQVVKCYLAADIFVFASTSETQGMVLVEAMAGGCPVVAVRASGVYDVIDHGQNGYKVAESTNEWATAIVRLLENLALLRDMSEQSRRYAERYSVSAMAISAEKLYRRVISRASAGR